MDYKKTIEDLKAFILSSEKEVKEDVKFAIEKEEVDAKPEVKAAPVAQFVTVTEFQEFKAQNDKFQSGVMESLSNLVELFGQNEKNTVPKELKKEVVEEKEEIELNKDIVVHSPEVEEKEVVAMNYSKNKRESVQDRVFNILSQN